MARYIFDINKNHYATPENKPEIINGIVNDNNFYRVDIPSYLKRETNEVVIICSYEHFLEIKSAMDLKQRMRETARKKKRTDALVNGKPQTRINPRTKDIYLNDPIVIV